MYLNFWPDSVDRAGAAFPRETLDANRNRTLAIEWAAARAALASRTVAPESSFEGFGANICNDYQSSMAYMHSAGAGTPALSVPSDPFAGAPEVVALNPESWSSSAPAEHACGASNPYGGVPWADAGMYRPALENTAGQGWAEWARRYPVKALLLAVAGGFGLYALGKK